MRISVIICTWNRCELLRRALQSLCSLNVPPGHEWELLVVDNDSSDATEEVVAAHRTRLPLRRLFEPQLGVSRARNAGLREATGDLILFTDDDVRVGPGWMSAHVDAALRWPELGYFTGPIRPDFAPNVPRWVSRHQRALAGMLCLRDAGSVSRRLRPGELPYGPNLAVRREVLELASFDERVGRKADDNLRGSETSLFQSLWRQGVHGAWVAEAEVHHYIPQCRANSRYLWSYYHGMGRTEVRLTMVCRVQSRRQLLAAGMRTLAGTCRRPLAWPRHMATVAWMSGQFTELGRLAFRSYLNGIGERHS